MQVGDLVKNKATGDLSIVTGVGGSGKAMWLTLFSTRYNILGKDVVYHAEYFEVVSKSSPGADVE